MPRTLDTWPEGKPFPHGQYGYRLGCRCPVCRDAKRTANQRLLAQDRIRHGTPTAYRAGCRCDECRDAKRDAGLRSAASPAAAHGTITTYSAGCRCEACRGAHAHYKAEQRAKRLARADFTHGTDSGYQVGCRCADCRAAHNAAARARRARKNPAPGTEFESSPHLKAGDSKLKPPGLSSVRKFSRVLRSQHLRGGNQPRPE